MRSAGFSRAVAAALMLAATQGPALPEPAPLMRRSTPKQPDPERQAAAEAKRQRKAAKRAADAAKEHTT